MIDFPLPTTQRGLGAPGAARARLWELHRLGTSLGANGLALSRYVNSNNPGAASPTTTEKAALMFGNETPEREIYDG